MITTNVKMKAYFLAVLSLFVESIAYGQSGDVTFWLPLDASDPSAHRQVARNKEYFSIKLHSVFAYYRSGFLENIRQLIVSSEISLIEEKRSLQGAMINKTWQRLDRSGDFIGINDHLALLSPATPTGVRVKISFRGVGEDVFKKLFDLLSDSNLKTALDFSPVTAGKVGAITPMVQRLLGTPYTSDNPRQILDVEQSFAIYPGGTREKPDSLREGYLVVFSAREKKSDDLARLLSLAPGEARLGQLGQGLEFKEGGVWKPFVHNSYVVFSVTKVPVRGEDEGSAWFKKYNEAIGSAEKATGHPADKTQEESLGLWREGNALLAADSTYIQSERDGIKFERLAKIKETWAASIGREVILNPQDLGVPPDYAKRALAYHQAVASQLSKVELTVLDSQGVKVPNAVVKIASSSSWMADPVFKAIRTDKSGNAETHLLPGHYVAQVRGQSNFIYRVIVEPYMAFIGNGKLATTVQKWIMDPAKPANQPPKDL